MEDVTEGIGFDADALRARYASERDKRVRRDGSAQYVAPEGDFKHYVDDPYVQVTPREAIARDTDVAVVGAGFGGTLTGAFLRKAGVRDVTVIEKGGGFGGVWYWNRYPGIACDMESYVYLPLLEETGYVPPMRYCGGEEIRGYVKLIAERHDLVGSALLGTEVTSVTWDEGLARWVVATNRGDTIRARFVCNTNGTLSRPKLPGIPGIDRFAGHTFHTSRWDYAYTGGSEQGGLDRLGDKRVGIIGTGATAIQCVPHLAEAAGHLYVFQRTPSSVDVRGDRPTDRDWFASQPAGWAEARRDNFNVLLAGGHQEDDLVNDGWTAVTRRTYDMVAHSSEAVVSLDELMATSEIADFAKMEELRGRVSSIVADEATAEALKPYYRHFCKRPCFHDEYLPAFNRDNVTLVDTSGRGVEEITEGGVVVDGAEYPLDCLILSTGFETAGVYTVKSGYEVFGRGGVPLSEHWADGVTSLHGMSTRGFPNCFFLSNFQSGFALNYTHTLTEEARHVAHVISRALGEGVRTIEPNAADEAAWVEAIVAGTELTKGFLTACTPGYYNNEGRLHERSPRNSWFAGGSPAFFAMLEAWRADGTMRGMAVEPGAT